MQYICMCQNHYSFINYIGSNINNSDSEWRRGRGQSRGVKNMMKLERYVEIGQPILMESYVSRMMAVLRSKPVVLHIFYSLR